MNSNHNHRHQGWVVSLNTGETLFEEEALDLSDDTDYIPPMTSWDQILERCENEQNLQITQLRLQRNGRTITSMPKAAGYFQGYELRPTRRGRKQMYQGIGFIYDNMVFINWVNFSGVIIQEVRPLGSLKHPYIGRTSTFLGETT